MDGARKQQITLLSTEGLFDSLTTREKLYAHYAARAAWLGTRIILSQVSPEAEQIYDFILELYRVCDGDWTVLRDKLGVSGSEMTSFLEYAAMFLHNIGNYTGHGDVKFTPAVDESVIVKLSHASAFTSTLYTGLAPYLPDPQPSCLGFASSSSQTCYYTGEPISREEVAVVSDLMEEHCILPENTRIRKSTTDDKARYEIFRASTDDVSSAFLSYKDGFGSIHLIGEDHARELKQVYNSLASAHQYAANANQSAYISNILTSLKHGDMEKYKEAQKYWIQDENPRIETVFGFVEPYRDPYGIRAEFEGLVGVVHEQETQLLSALISNGSTFISSLPWAHRSKTGNGPFETDNIGHRTFTSVRTLAYCSSLVFPGINLPNYNDIRENSGYKNILITNSMDAASMSGDSQGAYIQPHESARFLSLRKQTYYLWVVFHELFGHGTGKLLAEVEPGVYNFDIQDPPINLVTGKPVTSWYSPKQTWSGVFGDIATSVDECRAECIGAILFGNRELLEMFDFTDKSQVTASDLEYNLYLLLGVAGLRSLENYSVVEKKWGQAHSRAHFAMFRTLLEQGQGFMKVNFDKSSDTLTVSIDRSKLASHGRSSLEDLALRLHMFRCTADVQECREFYDDLTSVDGQYVQWASTIVANKPPPRIFVQPNTFLDEDVVTLKEYTPTIEGMIQSWAERHV